MPKALTGRLARTVAYALLSAGTLACVANGEEAKEDDGCVSTEKFFANEVWGPILSTNCITCHNPQGAARETKLVLQSSAQTGFMEANFRTVKDVAAFEVDGTSILLLKPIGQLEHEGGVRIQEGGDEYRALQSLVEQYEKPIACSDEEDDSFFAGVVYLKDRELLRKVGLNLVGRLPTPEEIALVDGNGEAGIDQVLDGMMTEEAFYDRIKEIYNDQFLTDRYYRYSRAIDLLDDNDYPESHWYEAELDETRRNTLRYLTNSAVAREPLELVAYVIREERPFTEILTAPYILVNPFSARTYGVRAGFEYQDGAEPTAYDWNDFREAQIAVPHAGVLTSHMMLNRFPTTDTNVNRHRSRMIYKLFLATDVLKLAERPVDPTQIEDFNPTMYNPACTACHATIDPVAGAFQNWDERGRYRVPENGWHEDMRPPGFGEETIPHENRERSLQWLGQRITQDERFATAAIHTIYRALTGQAPISAQTAKDDPTELKLAKIAAFDAQNELFKTYRQRFIESGYNFKALVKMVAKSPFVRATDVEEEVSGQRALELAEVGGARLLTPEQLDRKIEAVLGYPWTRNWDSGRYLLEENEYRIFYGGIDSDTITTRITDPNGVMASIAFRMANEMSCKAVPHDFAKPQSERLLFPNVTRSFLPEDDNGFEIPSAVEAIKNDIRHLHARVLGEDVSAEELERTYQLFYETWKEGRDAVAADTLSQDLMWSCRATEDPFTEVEYPEERQVTRDREYTVRAWMAVVTYLLTDYRFLYE